MERPGSYRATVNESETITEAKPLWPVSVAQPTGFVPEVWVPGHGGPCRTELSLVRFENVGLRYGLGPEILRDLSFMIPPHSFQFLTGPSGAGKTSLLRLLFLSLRPTSGLVNLFGQDVSLLEQGCDRRLAQADRDRAAGFPPARPHDHLRERRVAVPRYGPRGSRATAGKSSIF